jgi:hypothetical protein
MAVDLDFERTLHRNAARELAPAGSLFDTFANQVMRRVDEVLAGQNCPWPPTPDMRRLLGQLRNHQGADRAVPLAALAERLDVPPRVLKAIVQELRSPLGVQIGSARGEDNGYFLCASEIECHRVDLGDVHAGHHHAAGRQAHAQRGAGDGGVEHTDRARSGIGAEMSTRDPMDTRHKMIRAGYTFIADSTCKGCKRPIQWWKTMNGKNCPFDPIAGDHDLTTVHWATCPQSKNFKADAREDAKLEAAKQEGAQRAVRREANYAAPKGRDEREVRALRQKTNARAVVLVGDNGAFSMAWRNGIPSEDLRHEVITAANEMKAVIEKGGR